MYLKYAPYDWLKYRGMAILVCRKQNCPRVTCTWSQKLTSEILELSECTSSWIWIKAAGRANSSTTVNTQTHVRNVHVRQACAHTWKCVLTIIGWPMILSDFLQKILWIETNWSVPEVGTSERITAPTQVAMPILFLGNLTSETSICMFVIDRGRGPGPHKPIAK